jgi:hypothetical protein
MPSSYTSNLAIEKPANGEQVGTWGSTVNDNMDIVDRLTSQVGSIALTGTTYTLTTSTSGALSEGHYSLIKFTGTPGGTCTVTISPNNIQRIYTIYNTTNRTVTMSQGSGSTVSVPAGEVAQLYADGAGSGASVVQLTDKLKDVLYSGDIGSTVQGYDADLAAIGALAKTNGNFIVGNGSTWVAESGNTALASLGVTATATELNKLDGVTASTAEINKLDGVTWSLANYNTLTATASELNKLDGVTATTAEINKLDGVTWSLTSYNGLTATAAELNKLDGVTWSLTSYNGLTATAAELNKLDGVTASTAEINKLDGVTWSLTSYNGLTATAAELNKLDGATVTTAELNELDGISSIGGDLVRAASASAQRTVLGLGDLAVLDTVNTAQLASDERMTTTNVNTAIASSSVGAVGTYALLGDTNRSLDAGDTIAGSALGYAGTGADINNSNDFLARVSGTPSGTWRCMGYMFPSSGESKKVVTTLFLRIA